MTEKEEQYLGCLVGLFLRMLEDIPPKKRESHIKNLWKLKDLGIIPIDKLDLGGKN